MEYYTYAYLREDGTPYYIGKGKGRRIFDKENRTSCPVPKDKKRVIYLKKNLTEDEAFQHEVYMISILGRKNNGTGILRNLTDGGEGFSSTAMKEFWEIRRNKKLQMWRNQYDNSMKWRNENYEFFNNLIQSVVNNRSHVYNYDTNSINEYT
jgi:hypothetical protein